MGVPAGTIGGTLRLVRAVIRAVSDEMAVQRVDAELYAKSTRSGIPVHFPFGFSSHVPHDGAVSHVFFNGGDPADAVALPPANPSKARFGQLQEGETVLYDAAGQRMLFRNGTLIEIGAARQLKVGIAGQTVLTVSPDGIYVNGTITSTGDIVAGNVSAQNHHHEGVKAGPDESGKPIGTAAPPPPEDPEDEKKNEPQLDKEAALKTGDRIDPADKSGEYTVAGRSLQKHGNRSGSSFQPPKGNPQAINKAGHDVLKNILDDPALQTEHNYSNHWGQSVDVYTENGNGRGARFRPNGDFDGFLEPKKGRQ